MKRYAVIAMMMLSASATAFDYKGVQLGASEAELTAALEAPAVCKSGAPFSERQCLAITRQPDQQIAYGPAVLNYIAGRFFDGKLERLDLSMSHQWHAPMADALRAKFGEPSSRRTEEYQNRMGGKFSGTVSTWSHGPEWIKLTEYCGALTDSCVEFSSPTFQAKSEALRDKIARGSTGNM